MTNKRNGYFSSSSESRYRPAGEKPTAESATDALKPREVTYKTTSRSGAEEESKSANAERIKVQKLAIVEVLKKSNRPLRLSELYSLLINTIPEKESLNSLLQTLIFQKQINALPLPSGKSNPLRRTHLYSLPEESK